MRNFIKEFFRLRKGEWRIVLPLGLLLMGNSIALNISEVVAISGFLDEKNPPQLLIVWVVDMLLIISVTGFYSLIVDRYDRISLTRGMIFFFALAYISVRVLFLFGVHPTLNYSILYLLSEQQWIFYPLVFWTLASDIFTVAQAKRLFPLMAAGGFMGQIIGLSIAASAPNFLTRFAVTSVELISLIVLIYLLSYIVISVGLRRVQLRHTRPRRETVRETLSEGWGFVREVPAFRYLTITIVGISFVLTIVEFYFLVSFDTEFSDPGHFQTNYSLFYLGVTLAALAIQGLFTSRLIQKINLKNVFFILPFVLVASIVGMIARPGVAIAILGFGLPTLTKDTVDDSARKAFQALVPEERRGRVSLFMDSYLYAIGTILGSLATGAILLAGSGLPYSTAYIYLPIAGLVALFAFFGIFKMNRVYDQSLFNWRLKRRQRRSSVLDKIDF
jgi:hypothetical protein